MSRPTTRINRTHIQKAKEKRTAIKDTPGGSGNSVAAIRKRLALIEEIISLTPQT